MCDSGEVARLTRELDDAHRAVALMIAASGGEIRVPDRLMVEIDDDWVIQRWTDLDTRATVFRARVRASS